MISNWRETVQINGPVNLISPIVWRFLMRNLSVGPVLKRLNTKCKCCLLPFSLVRSITVMLVMLVMLLQPQDKYSLEMWILWTTFAKLVLRFVSFFVACTLILKEQHQVDIFETSSRQSIKIRRRVSKSFNSSENPKHSH